MGQPIEQLVAGLTIPLLFEMTSEDVEGQELAWSQRLRQVLRKRSPPDTDFRYLATLAHGQTGDQVATIGVKPSAFDVLCTERGIVGPTIVHACLISGIGLKPIILSRPGAGGVNLSQGGPATS